MIARTAKKSGHAVAGVRLRRQRRTGPAVPGGDRRPPQASYRTAHGRVRSGDARRITCRASSVCGPRRRGAVPPASPGLRDPCMPDRGSRGGRDTAKPGRKPFGVRTASHAVATVRTVFGAVPGSGAPCRLQPAAVLAVRESAGNRSPGFRAGVPGRGPVRLQCGRQRPGTGSGFAVTGLTVLFAYAGRVRTARDIPEPARSWNVVRRSQPGCSGARLVAARYRGVCADGADARRDAARHRCVARNSESARVRYVRVQSSRVQVRVRACGRWHARFIRRSGSLRTPDPGR